VKTFSPSAEEAASAREWWVVDATGQTLGRLASEIAKILRGKHKPTFSPHLDTGDFVVVTNCEKIVVTGDKLDTVRYYRHSRYPGMLPKTKLGRAQIKKLRIYAGEQHPHEAQKPKVLEL
jgi:large subunit ribosomal protein L13